MASQNKPYHVALSYAHEQEAYVERVANFLRNKGVEVFFAPFSQPDLAGTNLDVFFESAFTIDAHFAVLFLSLNYIDERKKYPVKEAAFAIAGLKEGNVIPVLLGSPAVHQSACDKIGLPRNIGYIDDPDKSDPEKTAKIIFDKLSSHIHIDELKQQGRGEAESYFYRAAMQSMLGQHEKAFEKLNKAIELKPDYTEAYTNRGVIYGQKGDHDRAIKDFNKAIDLKPDDMAAYHNRGVAYGSKREFDRAIEDFNKAIDLDPNNAEAYRNRGAAYIGRVKNARQQ